MLSQEDIYQNLSEGNFSAIIQILVKHGNSLSEDPSIVHAIDIFIEEFLQKFSQYENEYIRDLYNDLDILFIAHKKEKYLLKDRHILAVLKLLKDRAPKNDLFEIARKYPDDAFCKTLIDWNPKKAEMNAKIDAQMANDRPKYIMPIDNVIGKKFEAEIGYGEGAVWVKVYLRSEELLDIIANHLRKLAPVGKVNISRSKSFKYSLTVYGQRPFAIEETLEQVELTLDNYFSRGAADPIFERNVFSGISEVAYYQVIDYMLRLGKALEGTRKLAQNMQEEQYRDYFINYLDSLSTSHSVTGETFRGSGKADILVRNSQKEVLMVAECKLWKGGKSLHDAATQLFTRYLLWRDGKAALLIFNTEAKGFSSIIQTAVETLKQHPLCASFDMQRTETSYSFTFRANHDEQKLVKLELVMFNFV